MCGSGDGRINERQWNSSIRLSCFPSAFSSLHAQPAQVETAVQPYLDRRHDRTNPGNGAVSTADALAAAPVSVDAELSAVPPRDGTAPAGSYFGSKSAYRTFRAALPGDFHYAHKPGWQLRRLSASQPLALISGRSSRWYWKSGDNQRRAAQRPFGISHSRMRGIKKRHGTFAPCRFSHPCVTCRPHNRRSYGPDENLPLLLPHCAYTFAAKARASRWSVDSQARASRRAQSSTPGSK